MTHPMPRKNTSRTRGVSLTHPYSTRPTATVTGRPDKFQLNRPTPTIVGGFRKYACYIDWIGSLPNYQSKLCHRWESFYPEIARGLGDGLTRKTVDYSSAAARRHQAGRLGRYRYVARAAPTGRGDCDLHAPPAAPAPTVQTVVHFRKGWQRERKTLP